MKKRGVDFKKRDVSLYFGVAIFGVVIGFLLVYFISETTEDTIGKVIKEEDNIENTIESGIEAVSNENPCSPGSGRSENSKLLMTSDGKLLVFYTRARHNNPPGSNDYMTMAYSIKDKNGLWIRDLETGIYFGTIQDVHALIDSQDNIYLFWKGFSSKHPWGEHYKKGRLTESNQIVWGETIFLTEKMRNPWFSKNASLLKEVAVDNENNLHFIWISSTYPTMPGGGELPRIFYLKGENGIFSGEIQVLNQEFNVRVESIDIASDSRNNIHVVWSEIFFPDYNKTNLVYRKFDHATQTWGEITPLLDNIFSPHGPLLNIKMIAGDEGRIGVFASFTPVSIPEGRIYNKDVHFIKSDDYGNPGSWWEQSVIANPGYGCKFVSIFNSFPPIEGGFDSNKNPHLFCASEYHPNWPIYYFHDLYHFASSDGGATWKKIRLVNDDEMDGSIEPNVYIDGQKVHITWSGTCNWKRSYDIYYRNMGVTPRQVGS